MFLMLATYIPSSAWPTLGYDKERSSYQSVPGANITSPTVKWRVAVTPSVQRSCGPVIADVRGDYPGCEVIVYDGLFAKCLDGETGNAIWSTEIDTTPGFPNSTPAVGDVNGDGIPEVIIAQHRPGTLICLNGQTGREIWRDTVGLGQLIMAPVCLTDVSGDNIPEILVGQQFSDTLFCYNGNGTIRWKSQPLGIGVSINGISAGNVDGNPGNEIIVSINDMTVGIARCIVCLNSSGTIMWKYPSGFLASTASTVTATLGDVTGDGRLDVIVYRGDNNKICALQGSNGSEIWTYSIPNNPRGDTLYLLFQNLGAWDVTGDGRAEVFFGTGGADDTVTHDTTSWQSWFICLNSDGSERWRYLVDYWCYDGGPAVCDIDGDGALEFLKTADDGFLYVLNAETGEFEWRYDWYDQDDAPKWTIDAPIAVGDIDGDLCSEIVTLSSGEASVGNEVTALDGPGTGCWDGDQEGSGYSTPILLARPGRGVLYLGVKGVDRAEAVIWDASGRRVGELSLGEKPAAVPLPGGIYFVEARCGATSTRGKAVVY